MFVNVTVCFSQIFISDCVSRAGARKKAQVIGGSLTMDLVKVLG